MTARLDLQVAFLNEADKLKSITRATTLADGSRPENSAEHSWHLTLYALVLADQAKPGVDITRVIKMLILQCVFKGRCHQAIFITVEIGCGSHQRSSRQRGGEPFKAPSTRP